MKDERMELRSTKEEVDGRRGEVQVRSAMLFDLGRDRSAPGGARWCTEREAIGGRDGKLWARRR